MISTIIQDERGLVRNISFLSNEVHEASARECDAT